MSYTSNRTLLEKADLTLSDLTTSNGVLKPAYALTFMRLLIKESVLMSRVTVKPMASPKDQISKIALGNRVLRPGTEAVALTQSERVKPDLSHVELDASLWKAEINLSDEVLEDNIERGEFRQTLMTLMAEAISRDMEELVINGNRLSSDPFLAVMDGILAQANTFVVDAVGTKVSADLLQFLLKALPSEHLRHRNMMRFLTSVDTELDYRTLLSARLTGVGDRFLETDAPIMHGGVRLLPIPLFPENLGEQSNQTTILLINPSNIAVGIWRQIRFETDRDISAGVLKIVATLRFDVKIIDPTGVAKAINVGL